MSLAWKGLRWRVNNFSGTKSGIHSDIPGIPNGKLFTGETGNIKIYNCDALALTSEIVGGKFDIIWDRGSLVALVPPDRAGYIEMLQKLSKLETNILLEAFEYDWDQMINKGPPHPLFRKDINDLFEPWTIISEEDRMNKIDEIPIFRKWGLQWMNVVTYLMIYKA